MTTQNDFSLMLHGGAGALENVQTPEQHDLYKQHLFQILEQGRKLLEKGAKALDAVTTCAALLEDDELFNAGAGSVLNENGKIEMDAAIMDGIDLRAGSVAEISNIKNPIKLSRKILEHCEHVMLVGAGAMQFAEHYNIETAPDDYFLTEDRIQQWNEAHRKHRIGLDHDSPTYQESRHDDKYGTIGTIARDVYGNLAAATSTGGVVNKLKGRIGDSPIIGSGVYADNETCAVSCTGFGEDFLRTVLAKTASDLILFKNLDAVEAVDQTINYLTRKLNGRGGLILIDKHGNCASGFTTKKMIRGWIEHGNEAVCTLEK